MKKLLLATHNPAKVEELKIGLKPLAEVGIELVSLVDLGIKDVLKETGETFEENALQKAEFYANLAHLSVIADDGGVAIESLNGEPGVKSRLWLGREATDEELIKYTLRRLKDFPKKDQRRAYFETCLMYFDPISKRKVSEKERINGYISSQLSSKRIKGYPFRSLFIVDEFNKYYGELTEKEHQQINHRLKALKRLVQKLKTDLLQ